MSWYSLGDIVQTQTPSGESTTRVRAVVPEYGVRCVCYPGVSRRELAPVARPYSMETRIGTTRWTCNCNNSIDPDVTPQMMASFIPTKEFSKAATNALVSELGGGTVLSRMRFVEAKEERRTSNLLVLGAAVLALGGATVWYLRRRKKS